MLDRLFGGGDDDPAEPTADEESLFGEELEEGNTFDDDLGLEAEGEEAAVDELKRQVDEFEDDLESLHATVDSIENDQERLGEDVADVRDNVRKLLEIYEMVTQGINPFASGDEFGEAGSSAAMDIFGTDEEAAAEETENDAFFADEDPSEQEGPVEEAESPLDDDDPADEGRTFDDLKAEYEGEDPDEPPAVEDEDAPEAAPSTQSDPVSDAAQAGSLGEKPYLHALPEGYTGDLIVMTWMEDLLERTDAAGAAGTLAYYEAIGWVTADVADQLQRYLAGLGRDDPPEEPEPTSPLDRTDHLHSLRYLNALATREPRRVVVDGDTRMLEGLVGEAIDAAETAAADVRARPGTLADGGPTDESDRSATPGAAWTWLRVSDLHNPREGWSQ